MVSVLAHNAGADSLPAPSWLIGYLGALVVLGAAVALRGSWTTARLAAAEEGAEAWAATSAPVAGRWRRLGHLVGLTLLVLTFLAAVVGPDSGAENVSTLAVFVVWFYGLPLLALVLGDVTRAINPFEPVVAALERLTGRSGDAARAPSWTAAVFLFGFGWVFIAYHRPGSPRVVAVTLAVYTVAAVAGGLRWGRAWLATGEAFGAISAFLARVTGRGRAPLSPGVLPLGVVWIGSVLFDRLLDTDWWVDVLGTSTGWSRTLLNTVGLVWMTAIVAAVALVALRVAEAAPPADDGERPAVRLVTLLGLAVGPLAAAWFLADNLPLLLAEGQSFLALVSDPVGRGWDLFGTTDITIDYGLARADWVQWAQLAALLAGHLGAVVLAHDGAIARLGRRRGMRVTWTLATVAAGSFVAASLFVLG